MTVSGEVLTNTSIVCNLYSQAHCFFIFSPVSPPPFVGRRCDASLTFRVITCRSLLSGEKLGFSCFFFIACFIPPPPPSHPHIHYELGSIPHTQKEHTLTIRALRSSYEAGPNRTKPLFMTITMDIAWQSINKANRLYFLMRFYTSPLTLSQNSSRSHHFNILTRKYVLATFTGDAVAGRW